MKRAGILAIIAAGLASAVLAVAQPASAGTARPAISASSGSSLDAESCPSATLCFAVGDYWYARQTRLVPLAEKWDGKRWTALHMPEPAQAGESYVEAVSCSSATACIAVGYFEGVTAEEPLAEQWNGHDWVIRAVPHDGILRGVSCKSPTFCLAVGYYLVTSGYDELAAVWNGRKWTVQRSTPDPGADGSFLNWIACTSPTWCSAVGYAQPTATTVVPLAQAWNGHRWSVQGAANPAGDSFGELLGESCNSPTSCYAVGNITNSSQEPVALAEHWNGHHWTYEDTPALSGAITAQLNSVACRSTTYCTAVGSYTNGMQYLIVAEHWNGHAWAVQTTPDVTAAKENFLTGVRCPSATTCVAVGTYSGSSSPNQTLAEVWNGTKWVIKYPGNPSD